MGVVVRVRISPKSDVEPEQGAKEARVWTGVPVRGKAWRAHIQGAARGATLESEHSEQVWGLRRGRRSEYGGSGSGSVKHTETEIYN